MTFLHHLLILLVPFLCTLNTAGAAVLELDIVHDAASDETELQWQGDAGSSYRVYQSGDLIDWTPFTDVLLGTGQLERIPLQASQPRQYFVLRGECDIAFDIAGPAQTPIGRIPYELDVTGTEPILGIAWSVDSTNAVVDLPGSTNTHIYFFEPGSYTVACVVTTACGSATQELVVATTLTAGSPSDFAAAPRELGATLHSIGLEWDLPPADAAGSDSDHDGFGMMRVRPSSGGPWTVSMPLLRIDYNYPDYVTNYGAPPERNPWNMIAGSLLFLEPGTDYELEIQLADPDGGRVQLRQKIQTRPEPARRPVRYYVRPGGGGGSGTQADPFRGIGAAEAVAVPGDVFYLLPGSYGERDISKSGTRANPIQWQSSPGARFTRLYPRGSYVEFFDLRVGAAPGASTGNAAIICGEDCVGVVMKSCIVTNFNAGIILRASSRDWTILDCTISGINDPGASNFGGEGIELNKSEGHAVGYNRISRVGDGVSYANRNCDIYHNDIFDTSVTPSTTASVSSPNTVVLGTCSTTTW